MKVSTLLHLCAASANLGMMMLLRWFTKKGFQKDLNDDCWEQIFESLSLEDQISVARTCRRFNATLSTLWQKKYRNFSKKLQFPVASKQYPMSSCEFTRKYQKFDVFIKNFAVFIKSIHSTVESMELVDMSSEEWDIIKLYTYPNLRHFSLEDFSLTSDEQVLKMTEIFPNLQSFSPKGAEMSGKHIEKFRYLEHLDLEYSDYVTFRTFEKLLEELPLTSVRTTSFISANAWRSSLAFKKFCNLTHISANMDVLVWLSDLSLFSNLKMVEFPNDKNFENKICRSVVNDKHNDLVEIRDNGSLPAELLFVRSYPNLEKITLHERHTTGFISMSRHAPNLREIFINNAYDLKEDDIYVWLNCTQIELISVEDCSCKFPEFELKVQDIMEHRTSLLHFNFYKNKFKGEEVTLRVVGENPLLKISEIKLKTDKVFSLNLLRFR